MVGSWDLPLRSASILSLALQAVPENLPLDIVYEDEHLIVVNKVRFKAK